MPLPSHAHRRRRPARAPLSLSLSLSPSPFLSLLAALSSALWSACDAPPKRLDAPLLSVTPDPIALTLTPGAGEAEARVTLSNAGGYDLVITGVVVVEDDDTPELSLKEEADWRAAVTLTAGETRTLTVTWRPTDALPDAGALRVTSAVGDRAVPITTAAPAPAPRLLAPRLAAGAARMQGGGVTLTGALTGGAQVSARGARALSGALAP
ncbi:MAG: hypothetical protein FJ138_14635 [Deltaproteobacteria bacterium]|nr:hypothetical protein [Deltaproteobacteria bacterium]